MSIGVQVGSIVRITNPTLDCFGYQGHVIAIDCCGLLLVNGLWLHSSEIRVLERISLASTVSRLFLGGSAS